MQKMIAKFVIEWYMKDEYLDEQSILTSYVKNEKFLKRQNHIKKFLSSKKDGE